MKKWCISAFACLFLFSCGGKNIPDVSKIDVTIQLQRFDQDLDNLKKDSVSNQSLKDLEAKYPEFAPIFFENLASIAVLGDSSARDYIKGFLFNADIAELHADVQKEFADLEWFMTDVTEAFQFYKYYFPNRYVPKVLTYSFGFNNRVVALDSTICISLDQYLGADSKYYEHLPEYITYRMDKPYMVSELMQGWISAEFASNTPMVDMLDEMIYQGKVMYTLRRVLPHTADSILWGYTGDQVKFCKNNEYQMWSHMLKEKLLYTRDTKQIAKFCGEAPFTAGMPRESPGRTGNYLGWKIVEAFMKHNKNITIEQLMMNNNAKQILNSSKYKPRK